MADPDTCVPPQEPITRFASIFAIGAKCGDSCHRGLIPRSSRGGAVICRVARVDEWPTLKDIRLRALTDSPESFLESLSEAVARDDESWRETFDGGRWHVVESEGRWVGLTRSSTYEDAPDEYYLEAFWIDPGYRDKGIGRRLIAHVAGLAVADGRKSLRLAVLHSNDERRPVFEKLGFVADGPPNATEQQMVYEI